MAKRLTIFERRPLYERAVKREARRKGFGWMCKLQERRILISRNGRAFDVTATARELQMNTTDVAIEALAEARVEIAIETFRAAGFA